MSKKKKRQNRILNQLELNPRIRVNEMAEDLGVSTETVRRDLAELDGAGRIQRTYGGAVSIKTFEPALAERRSSPRSRRGGGHVCVKSVISGYRLTVTLSPALT